MYTYLLINLHKGKREHLCPTMLSQSVVPFFAQFLLVLYWVSEDAFSNALKLVYGG